MSDSNLRPASFRGVAFVVQTDELTTGRRTVVHNFPGKDDPYVEDLGRKTNEFSVEGFVVGKDYASKRDTLLEALEKLGPGTLIHPYYGERIVQVGDVSVKHTWENGGMAVFSIKFTQSGKVSYPVTSVNVSASVLAKSAGLDSSIAAFAGKAITSPDTLTTGNLLTSAQKMVDGMKKNLTSAMGKYDQTVSQIDKFQRDLNRLGTDLTNLVKTPAEMIKQFQNIIRRFGGIATPLDAVKTYRRLVEDLYNVFASSKYPDSATGAISTKNDSALQSSILASCAAAASDNLASASEQTSTVSTATGGTLTLSVFESRQQAESLRDQVLAWLEEISVDVPDDSTFVLATDLRVAVNDAVPPDGVTLRDLKELTLQQSVPAIVLAHRLYGDTAMADDLVKRNKVKNPAIIPGGVKLEVLS